MELVSTCPLGVGSFAWQPHPAAHVLTIVCKATFTLEPGVSPLAEEQEEVASYDNHWDDDEGASLYAPSDLTPQKRRADVMLVGSVFAPGGRPARSVAATLRVDGLEKSIEVHCDRAFARDGTIREGAAFTRMALRWERAAGGPTTVNPVGVRASPNADGLILIPNLQPPGRLIAQPGDAFEPIGFGPIAPAWPSRARVLRAHAQGFAHARWFERPLPPNVDLRYFNAAPADQQIDALSPGARIALTNLHPRHPELVTTLARVRPRARIERPGRAAEAVELACDTLWIDTDRRIAVLVFRGNAMLSRPDEAGRAVISLDAEAPLAQAALPAPKAPPPKAPPVLTAPPAPNAPPVPKAPPAPPAPPLPKAPPAPTPPPRRRAATLDSASLPALVRAALPFVPVKRGDDGARKPEGFSAPRAAPPVARVREETSALDIDALRAQQAARRGALPFSQMPALENKAPPPTKAAWADEPTGTVEIDRLRAEREALPFSPSADEPSGRHRLMSQPAPEPRPADGPKPAPTLPIGDLPRTPAATLPFVGPAPKREPALAMPFIEPVEARAPAATMPFIEPAPGRDLLETMALEEPPLPRAPAPTLTSIDLVALRAGPAPALPFAAPSPPVLPPIAAPSPPIAAPYAPPIPVIETRAAPIAAPIIEDPPTISTQEAPGAEAIPIDAYATVKAALWGRDDGADVARALRDLGLDEDAYRAGEERIHEALANEARAGRATLARAVRAAIKRAVREKQARQPRVSQASGNVPAG